jgi:hypothetical protein
MASGGVPRFIIHLTKVVWHDDNTNADVEITTNNGDRYLTVTGYEEFNVTPAPAVTTFERGKIYTIGGEDGITFDEDDLGITPNPVDLTLTVTVDVDDWVLDTLSPIL